MTKLFTTLTLASLFLTAFLYWYGLTHFFFWYYPWYDIPIHILGGLTVGMWACSLAAQRGFTPRQTLIFALLLVIAVGCLWELFEYVTGISREIGFWFDTIKDMVDDILGTLAAVVLYRATYKRKDNV